MQHVSADKSPPLVQSPSVSQASGGGAESVTKQPSSTRPSGRGGRVAARSVLLAAPAPEPALDAVPAALDPEPPHALAEARASTATTRARVARMPAW